MRLSEITEALPGTKKGFFSRIAQPFSNVKAALDFKIAIKKAYDLWVEQAVPNLISRGLDMNDPTTYIRSFQTWLAPRLRLKNDHKILQDLVANLTRLGISKSTLTDQMSIALKAKSNLAPPTPGAPPTSGAPPAARVIKTGSQRKASDGQMYRIVRLRDGSREWHDLTGNRAVDTIQQELGRKYGV